MGKAGPTPIEALATGQVDLSRDLLADIGIQEVRRSRATLKDTLMRLLPVKSSI